MQDAKDHLPAAAAGGDQMSLQAETAGLALAIGSEAGLSERNLELFVNFIAQRFPDERSEAYIMEWAARFISGTEWQHGDGKSRGILKRLAIEMNLDAYTVSKEVNEPWAWSNRL